MVGILSYIIQKNLTQMAYIAVQIEFIIYQLIKTNFYLCFYYSVAHNNCYFKNVSLI